MPARLAAADLVVCRAGSGTCFELAATGRPAVMIPSLVTTGGQQVANAERVAAVGGAVVVRDDELDADRLVHEVDALLADPDRLAEMSARIRSLGAPGAATRVAELVEQHGRAPVTRGAATLLDLTPPRRIHVVNVGGAGMSAIATVLAQMGHDVTGTDDKRDAVPRRRCAALGVDVVVGDQRTRRAADGRRRW